MAPMRAFDVFTPGRPAGVNFVDRRTVNNRLVDALQTPGKQLIVYGETGSGKSSLVQKKLEQIYEGHVTTRCSATMTFQHLLLDAFDKLDKYYIAGASSTTSQTTNASLALDFSRIRASIGYALQREDRRDAARICPPQLT